MALTGYAIGGIVMIVVGIILLIAGIIVLAIDQSNQTVSEWWVWALIVVAVIALLVGIALFFIPEPKTNMEKTKMEVDPCNPCPKACPPPPCTVDLEPVCPKACPPPNPCNPCKPSCSMDIIHKDACKQTAAHAAEGLPPPARAGGPEAIIMPAPPAATVIAPRPTASSVRALERPRPLDPRRPFQNTSNLRPTSRVVPRRPRKSVRFGPAV